MGVRVLINLPPRLVAELDHRVGRQKRSAFIAETLRRALADERRWDDILASVGKVGEAGHDWDKDPAAWVREQRRGN